MLGLVKPKKYKGELQLLYDKQDPIPIGPFAPVRINPTADGKPLEDKSMYKVVKRECKNLFHTDHN